MGNPSLTTNRQPGDNCNNNDNNNDSNNNHSNNNSNSSSNQKENKFIIVCFHIKVSKNIMLELL